MDCYTKHINIEQYKGVLSETLKIKRQVNLRLQFKIQREKFVQGEGQFMNIAKATSSDVSFTVPLRAS